MEGGGIIANLSPIFEINETLITGADEIDDNFTEYVMFNVSDCFESHVVSSCVGNGSSGHGGGANPVFPPSSVVMLYLMSLFYSLVFVVGFIGNTLVIYVVLRYSKMQTVTNTYILNLALADELFLIGIPFLIITMSVHDWIFGYIMCKLYMTTTSINQFTSSIFLTVMSADRYIAVCHPISSPRYRTPFISKVVCLTSWTASALLMVPNFMYADLIHNFHESGLTCNIVWPEYEFMNGQTAFTLYCFILSFAAPVVLISVFYFMVVRRLKTVGPRHKSKEKKKSHRKVTKLVLTVVTVYMACWLPYWTLQVALTFSEPMIRQSDLHVMLHLVAGCLTYSNSAVNPVLYAFLSENFKKSFIKACICSTGTDVNEQLRIENSVFPRKNRPGSEKTCTKEQESDDDNCNEVEPSTAITMTSRSANTSSSHCGGGGCGGNNGSEKEPMLNNCRNGYHHHHHLHPHHHHRQGLLTVTTNVDLRPATQV